MSVLASLFYLIMPWIGLLAILALITLRIVPRLPWRFSKRLAEWYLSNGIAVMGREVALVRTTDNKYTLSRAEYDADNGVLWVDYGESLKGYSTNGEGLKSLPFLGTNLWLVYENLGAVMDIVAPEIARAARANYDEQFDGVAGGSISRDDTVPVPALADGGETQEPEGKHQVLIPSSGVVADLRNAIQFAPYDVKPHAFKRVEENAKLSVSGFNNWGSIAQVGGMLGAFFMGALITWWVSGDSNGGNGGGEVVPMTLSLLGVA